MRQSRQLHDLADAVFGEPLASYLCTPDHPGQVVSRAPGVRRVALDLAVRPVRPDSDVAAASLQLDIHLRALTVGEVIALEHCTPSRHLTPPGATPTTGRSRPDTAVEDPSAAAVVALEVVRESFQRLRDPGESG
jgi:hypothetical protein